MNTSDMHPFIHRVSPAVDQPEAAAEIYKAIAKFSWKCALVIYQVKETQQQHRPLLPISTALPR